MQKVKQSATKLNAPGHFEKVGAVHAVKVEREEPHVEYDAEQLDDVLVSKMRVQAERCRADGRLVEGMFRARTGVLNFSEIDAAADELSRSATALRRMVALARVSAIVAVAAVVMFASGCCDSRGREPSTSPVVAHASGCVDGHCDAK